MIMVLIFSKRRINYFTYSIHDWKHALSVFFLKIVSSCSFVDLAYLLQNQLQESTRLKSLCGRVCMQMFSQVYCILLKEEVQELSKKKKKLKIIASGTMCVCVMAYFNKHTQ